MIKAKPEKKSKHPLPPDGYKFSTPSRINLCANSKAANDLIDLVTSNYFASRSKKLPRPQQELYRNHFEIILLDLFSAYLVSKVIWIGYSRGKSEFLKGGRYYNPISEKSTISKTAYLNSIDYLTTKNWIENWIAPAGYSTASSRMRAKSKLTGLFLEYGLNWTSLKTNKTYPSIIVKDKNKQIIPYPNTQDFDLEEALCNINEINETLSDTSVNLAISDNDFFELQTMLADQTAKGNEQKAPLDFTKRTVKRVFADGSFDYGGRFYGGWWQGVPSELRKYIEIDGKVTVELDYSTMTPRILYAEKRLEPPEDSYQLEGWDNGLRPIIKKAFNQLLNSGEKTKNPNQWHTLAPSIELDIDTFGMEKHIVDKHKNAEFEKQYERPYRDLLTDLLTKHEPIIDVFFSARWKNMQNVDSKIAEQVMLTLLKETPPVVALPIHDSFIVRRGAQKSLSNAMIQAFDDHVNSIPNITRDSTVYDPLNEQKTYSIVNANTLFDQVKKYIFSHKEYHKRNKEWEEHYGLGAWD